MMHSLISCKPTSSLHLAEPSTEHSRRAKRHHQLLPIKLPPPTARAKQQPAPLPLLATTERGTLNTFNFAPPLSRHSLNADTTTDNQQPSPTIKISKSGSNKHLTSRQRCSHSPPAKISLCSLTSTL